MQPTRLPDVLAAHIDAVNAHDLDAIMDTFAPDALANDVRREFVGPDQIRRWIAAEIVAPNVTLELVDVLDDHGDTIIRVKTDGDYDKTNLPDPLILTGYVKVGPTGIERLIFIANTDPEI
jgi:hypothetical protein